ncbi:DUF4179 domain-containing protein [Clostridium sp. LIBA-8841]|uniref:DUF4179 domain-containing protein n=1 Tax=Clostridium sp. LIBA-8841 TaxID=2987530 RepID=UPI002AC5FE48|nr:DUF4179 domain-containing protein [Clostridium sp. LIBA-8841]MDZ5254284.1 DUF4179 domain-containing protein [Clostridium sp. LIBA-8841]
MKKDKFRILNGLDNSKDKIDEINLSEVEKNSLKLKMRGIINEDNKLKNIKKKNRNKIIAASVSFIIVGTCILNSENVRASMTSLGKKIESYFGKEKDSLKSYKEEVLKSVEDKGITFSLNELILNDEELVVSMMVDYGDFDFESVGIKESKADNVSVYPYAGIAITSNGQEIDITGMGGSYDYNEENKVSNVIMHFDMTGADLEKDYNIKFNVDDMVLNERFKDEKFVKGNWTLDADFNGKKLKEKVEVINIDKTMNIEKYGHVDYVLTEIRKTPASTVIKYDYKEPSEIIEEGEKHRYIELEFYDENGKKLDFLSKGGSCEKGFSYEYKGNKELNRIKVVPVLYEERNAFLKFIGMGFKSTRLTEKEFYIDLK